MPELCDDCGEEATRYRRLPGLPPGGPPPGQLPQRTPGEQRELEENHTEIGHDIPTVNFRPTPLLKAPCLRAETSDGRGKSNSGSR